MSVTSHPRRVAVLGAGISGLSAAYHLLKLAPDISCHVWDTRNRVGGVLETIHENGFQVEQSADNFITTIPWGLSLCNELGLGRAIVQTNPDTRRTYVVRKGKLHLLPDGFLMMAPTKLWPLAVTPILSPLGKLRAGLELFIPSRRDDGDETLANFVRRRLGKEVFERLVEPLVSGVYAADMEKLSIMATLPRFREMEKKDGSLIWSMQRQLRANKAAHLAEQSGARYSMFVTLTSGLASLCDALAAKLPSDFLHLSRHAVAFEHLPHNNRYRITGSTGRFDEYDAVIFATSATAAAKLLSQTARQSETMAAGNFQKLGTLLKGIEHEGTSIVTFAFHRSQMRFSPRGMGFVVPKIEKSPILAASFSSLKYEHRAPEGQLLIRIFAGGARAPEMAELPDDKLVPILLAETKRILQVEGDPHRTWTAHWPNTMPQYHLGHRERMSEVQTLLETCPTLALCGNYFNGVGVPNCIYSGELAARKIAVR